MSRVVAACMAVLFALEVPSSGQGRALRLELVGTIEDAGVGISVYRDLAVVGLRGNALGGAFAILDISDPENPVKLGDTPRYLAAADETRIARIGRRVVLAVSLYGAGLNTPESPRGLKLIDITVPARAAELGFYPTGPGGLVPGQLFSGAIHFDVAVTPAGRTLALLSTPGSEVFSSNGGSQSGLGDLQIVDISDPTHPTLVGEWGVLDEPAMGPDFFVEEQRGARADGFAEGVHASADGLRAYIAYSDHGAIILDISDPTQPALIGHAGFDSRVVEGAAFDVRPAADGTLLLRTHLGRDPFQIRLDSNAYSGVRTSGESRHRPIYGLEGHSIDGEVIFVGRGCPDDPHLEDPAGKIALMTVSGCTTTLKAARAQIAGATAAIFYDEGQSGTDRQFTPAAGGIATMPDGTTVTVGIPAVGVGNNTGQCLAQARDENGFLRASNCFDAAPVTLHGLAVFQGFGQMDIFGLQNPDAPVRLSTFGTPNSFDLNRALTNPTRFLSANYLEVAGNLAFVSWELEGLRVVDFSNPSAPREVAAWSGEGRPPGAPPVHAWQVLWHRRSILLTSLSERKVYILKVLPGPADLPAVVDRSR